jgi:hypothetical protein
MVKWLQPPIHNTPALIFADGCDHDGDESIRQTQKQTQKTRFSTRFDQVKV